MTTTMKIIACPFCNWSAAFMSDNKERAELMQREYYDHLLTHNSDDAECNCSNPFCQV